MDIVNLDKKYMKKLAYNKRQHIAPAALDSQQVARLCGGSYGA
jgi:hypothetical protein